MRLALAIDGGLDGALQGFAVPIASATARALSQFCGAEVLILPTAGIAGALGTANLQVVETDASGGEIARFAAGHTLGRVTQLAEHLRGPFPLQLISEDSYGAILAALASDQFTQAAIPGGEISEVATGFDPSSTLEMDQSTDVPIMAVIETLHRETGDLCALTGTPVMPDTLPARIRHQGDDKLHLNNLLLLSPAAKEAFEASHLTIRDDLSIIVDFSRIDPELLEMINPNGRLLVPKNAALQPAAENLAWHRSHIFRLA